MTPTIGSKQVASRLGRLISDSQKKQSDSLAKLASGSVFEGTNSSPSDRAIAETMELRLRSLSASKRNINDAISLLQTAEGAMSEVSNLITRMKEINITAASTTLSDQERRYLFVEYEALHDEVNRIAVTTEFNGMPLLFGESEDAPEELIFRLDDPMIREEFDDETDVNTIRFDGLRSINATTAALGLHSARELLEDTSDEEGLELEDVEEMLLPEDDDYFTTSYDQATTILSTHRAVFGALQTRLHRALDYTDVYQENIAAAKSKIADTDYASEIANMVQAKVQFSAATAMLAHNNASSGHVLQLLNQI